MTTTFNKENLIAFMTGLDYTHPRDQYEEGWHQVIEIIKTEIDNMDN